MNFDLKCGFVGEKELFVARRYLEELIESYSNSKLFLEKRDKGNIKEIFFDEIDELLNENYIDEFKHIESYIERERDSLDEEDIESYKVSDEVKLMFDKLKQDELIYVLNDGDNIYINTSKEELILGYVSDGQYSFCYENINAALIDLENSNEMVAVFAYNKTNRSEKEKYLNEFNESKSQERAYD